MSPPPTDPAKLRRRLALAGTSLLLLGVLAWGGVVLYGRERQARRVQTAAEAWDRLRDHAARQDLPGVRAVLDTIAALTPDDPNLVRWQAALASGRADPSDPALVRLLMNEHLRGNRLDEAARAAELRVVGRPHDWQARCVLAHHALTRGRLDQVREHLAVLRSPFDLDDGLGPGPLLYALQLRRQLGDPLPPEWVNYLVLHLLPALDNSYLPHISLAERLQLLDAYAFALTVPDRPADLGRFWVPAAALGRQVLDDPAAGVNDLVRLGCLFEAQLSPLDGLRRRGELSPADVDRLGRELEDRIRAAWSRVHAKEPANAAAFVGLALAAARAGRAAEALATLERGLVVCGDRTEFLAALGRLLREIDPRAGLDLLQRAARARPDDLPRWRLLAEAALAAGRPDVALGACQEALRLQPALAWACRLRAEVLLGLGRSAEAVAALTPIRDDLAGDPAGVELYVRALAESKALAQVEPFLRRTADGPRPVPGLLGGARALLAAGRPDLASRWAEEATRHAPDDLAVRRLLADGLRAWAEQDGAPAWDRERVRTAINAYEWLRQREPEDLVVLNNIAWLQLKGLGQSDLAFRTLAPLRAKEGAADLSPEMLETLAAVYLARGQAEPAVRLLERAARSARPRASHLVHLALAYQQLGRRDDARRCLVRAATLPRSTREDEDLKQAAQRLD